MTNKDFYHNSTVISTQGFFTKEMKQRLFDKFDGMRQSPFKRFSDLAIKETGCTLGQADGLVNEWLDRDLGLTDAQIEKVVESMGFIARS